MTGIDTNVLVRYFLDDDPAQANKVDVFMRECRANHERVFVSCIVLCEFAWTHFFAWIDHVFCGA
jgi:predicted nucleic-acid-binding protein